MFMFLTGVRVGEVCGIRYEDIYHNTKIHRHHIVPKMLSEYFPGLAKNNYQSVILKNTVHTKITNRFNNLYKKMVPLMQK